MFVFHLTSPVLCLVSSFYFLRLASDLQLFTSNFYFQLFHLQFFASVYLYAAVFRRMHFFKIYIFFCSAFLHQPCGGSFVTAICSFFLVVFFRKIFFMVMSN